MNEAARARMRSMLLSDVTTGDLRFYCIKDLDEAMRFIAPVHEQ